MAGGRARARARGSEGVEHVELRKEPPSPRPYIYKTIDGILLPTYEKVVNLFFFLRGRRAFFALTLTIDSPKSDLVIYSYLLSVCSVISFSGLETQAFDRVLGIQCGN